LYTVKRSISTSQAHRQSSSIYLNSREPILATFTCTHKAKTPTFLLDSTELKTPHSFIILSPSPFLCLSVFLLLLFLSSLLASAMVLLSCRSSSSSSSSCSFGSCLTILCLLLVQSHIAFSAILMSLKNHHNNHQHNRPMIRANQSTCALFAGNWVRDDTYPMYQSSNCPTIIDSEFNCQMFGRPDSDYLKYRWKPLNCELPR
jgi:hypothetical protein